MKRYVGALLTLMLIYVSILIGCGNATVVSSQSKQKTYDVNCYSGGSVVYHSVAYEVLIFDTGWKVSEVSGRESWISGTCTAVPNK